MSKLHIYRALLIICLAAVAYVWPIFRVIFGIWAGGACMGAIVLALSPAVRQIPIFEITFSGILGPLRAWNGLWNGFYVWKDLDPDHWNRADK